MAEVQDEKQMAQAKLRVEKYIKDTKAKAQSVQESINDVQNKLIKLNENVGNLSSYTQNSGIKVGDFIDITVGNINNVMNKINTSLVTSRDVLETLEKDVNEKLSKKVSVHNNSVDAKYHISYKNIELTSVAGVPKVPKTDTGKGTGKGDSKSPYRGRRSSYRSSTTNTQPITNPVINPSVSYNVELMNDYLNKNINGNVNSNQIESWDLFSQSFLKEYNIDSYITGMSLENNMVICTMNDGEVYQLSNVENCEQLLYMLEQLLQYKGYNVTLSTGTTILNESINN